MGIGAGDYIEGSGIPDPNGPTYDKFLWGGRGQDSQNGYYVPGTSGADQDVDRYRQQGQQYGSTGAPGVDRSLSGGARGEQTDAMGLMRNAAYGGAPSAAEVYGKRLTDDSIDSAMSVAASSRGGPLSQAAAMQQAQTASAQQRAAGARDLSALRAQEMAQARGEYYGAAAGQRQQDIGVENYATDNEARQRAMNQADRQFYEQRGWDTRKQEQDAALQREKMGNDAWYQGRKATMEDEENEWGKIGDIASGAASFIGGIFSDMRAKENVYPVSGGIVRDNPYGGDDIVRENPYGPPPPAGPSGPSSFGVGMSAVGSGLSAFGGGGARSAFRPVHSDARSKYIVSDKQAKEEAFKLGMQMGRDAAAHDAMVKHPGFKPLSVGSKDMNREEQQRNDTGGGASKPGYAEMASMARQDLAKHPPSQAIIDRFKADGTLPADQLSKPYTPPPATYTTDPRAAAPAVAVPDVRAMVSDEKTKYTIDLDDTAMRDGASDTRTYNFDKSFRRDSKADQQRVKRGVEDKASKDADEMMGGYAASLARGSSVDPMVRANLAQEGSAYVYKPDFLPPEQQPGEQNVGPMAQTMASDPVASTAVKQSPEGYLVLDSDKLQKVQSAGIASLQQQILDMQRRWGRGR